MKTRPTKVRATDGTEITLHVPIDLPSDERAELLREVYKRFVKHPQGHWKGLAVAVVPPDMADLVAEAMDFHGSIVDVRQELITGLIRLRSDGYWAHGF